MPEKLLASWQYKKGSKLCMSAPWTVPSRAWNHKRVMLRSYCASQPLNPPLQNWCQQIVPLLVSF